MDFARYLPLSAAPARDEAGIGPDAAAAVALVIAEAARIAAANANEGPLVRAFVQAAHLASDAASAADLARTGETGSSRPPRIRELTAAVRALLVLADAAGTSPDLPDAVWGRVALYGATRADFARRAALRGNTVAASDAEWSFGRGPVLRAPQRDIVRFVLGLSDVPPRVSAPGSVQAPPESAPTRPDTSM
ncbi:hypothetical protein [Microbacterium dextranolyticum]|uniref:Uncharacterized protein n=1 Tax=Microbacterium dextranolyticum TaxID=36806 RepID=A0A9W6HPD1_9MICO|nr:hypothetical protein [Microbacterium dextranolyticum]MBM7462470.1 hypothetical protein [Microbacterium dextranolyticum]GLJ96698.1 hypothetical protein GCM10017591_27610 [Microbacterium dextranolyticum]